MSEWTPALSQQRAEEWGNSGIDVESLEFAGLADDRSWSEITGCCGGCGDSRCHPERPCDAETCTLCPERASEVSRG